MRLEFMFAVCCCVHTPKRGDETKCLGLFFLSIRCLLSSLTLLSRTDTMATNLAR